MNRITLAIIIAIAFIGNARSALYSNDYNAVYKEAVRKWRNNCLAMSGTHEDTLEEMKHGEFPDDPQLKAYIHCIFKYSGALRKDGTLDEKYFDAVSPRQYENKITPVITGCFENFKDENDMTERLYKTEKCVYDYDSDIFSFP